MSQIVLDTLVFAASVLLAASAIIALYRIVRGPSILDRMIATDVVLASIMCGLGGFMALSGSHRSPARAHRAGDARIRRIRQRLPVRVEVRFHDSRRGGGLTQ